MHKRFKLGRKYSISVNTFPKTAKNVSKVYHSGIRNWVAQDSYKYSIVLYRFRIIWSVEREQLDCKN